MFQFTNPEKDTVVSGLFVVCLLANKRTGIDDSGDNLVLPILGCKEYPELTVSRVAAARLHLHMIQSIHRKANKNVPKDACRSLTHVLLKTNQRQRPSTSKSLRKSVPTSTEEALAHNYPEQLLPKNMMTKKHSTEFGTPFPSSQCFFLFRSYEPEARS